MDDFLTMFGVAAVMGAIGTGFAVAALVHWIADRREARKWDRARKHLPYITE